MPGNINSKHIKELTQKQKLASNWFTILRNDIVASYEAIEFKYAKENNLFPAKFLKKKWDREGGGGGEISMMRGNVFEKVGVNISTVHGEFSEKFRHQIPGTENDPNFFATGISLVSHMHSPFVPAMHFNTRYIETSKYWFGGGGDLTPIFEDEEETQKFHNALKQSCDLYNSSYYARFKKECDEYFYLKHRKEARGVGGIFFDYLDNGNFENDFAFIRSVGSAIYHIYPEIVKNKMFKLWNDDQKKKQLIKRGRYVEFNLLYDRGTIFGLETGGNIDAIFMSLPPSAIWQ